VRWVTYLSDNQPRPGLLTGGSVYGLRGDRQLLDLLGDDGERLHRAAEQASSDPQEVLAFAEADLCAPIPAPPSIRDFMSFEEHVLTSRRASGFDMDPAWYENPVFYFTNPAAVCGSGSAVPVPPGSTEFDFELEVAAYIGLAGSDIAPTEGERHIAGYSVMCDWSARDLQVQEMRLSLGPAKGKDTATTLGPLFVTPDELEPFRKGNGFQLDMTASVNGVAYSHGSWSTIYWSFGQMVAYASRGTKLVPGDVIGSGTVGTGCIYELAKVHGPDRFPYLEPGDEVLLAVEQLGQIRNKIVIGSPAIPLA
jgi:2-keto-4-pentenoate hydratase/2-oxohepta-3-ene-1,7-dioic acid hydratase in catechol pathway